MARKPKPSYSCPRISFVVIAILGAIISIMVRLSDLTFHAHLVGFLVPYFTPLFMLADKMDADLEEIEHIKSLLDVNSPSLYEYTVYKEANYTHKDGFTIRYVHPNSTAYEAGEKRRVILFIHGGGWVVGSIDGFASMIRDIAYATDSIVIAPNYRKAPKYHFPTQTKDVRSAYKWIKKNIQEIGGDPTKIAVIGESAGGNLAAVFTLINVRHWLLEPILTGLKVKTSPPICGTILASPVVSYMHAVKAEGSWKKYGSGQHYLLSTDVMRAFWRLYLGRDGNVPDISHRLGADSSAENSGEGSAAVTERRVTESVTDKIARKGGYRVSPLLAPEWRLQNMAPTLITCTDTEILADEIEEFYDKIKKSGNKHIEIEIYKGILHGYYGKKFMASAGPKTLERSRKFLDKYC